MISSASLNEPVSRRRLIRASTSGLVIWIVTGVVAASHYRVTAKSTVREHGSAFSGGTCPIELAYFTAPTSFAAGGIRVRQRLTHQAPANDGPRRLPDVTWYKPYLGAAGTMILGPSSLLSITAIFVSEAP